MAERAGQECPAYRKIVICVITENMARILIVEDNLKTSQAICNSLQEKGHQTLTAFNGLEALPILGKEPLDLIVLDLNMPRMRGEEVLQKLRRLTLPQEIDIVIYSSQATAETGGQRYGTKIMYINSRDLKGPGRPTLKPIEITLHENISYQLVRVVDNLLEEQKEKNGKADPAKITILIVEDNPTTLAGISHRLEKENLEVFTAADGEKALESLHKYKDKIKLVILDLNLPKISGSKVLKFIREDKDLNNLPVILMTAEKSDEFILDNRTSLHTGTVEELITEVKKLV